MSALQDAAQLEELLPRAMAVLFRSTEDDPLGHSSEGQVRLMRCLSLGSRSARDLCAALGLSPSSLTQMASRLVLAGLVEKDHDDHDRRVRRLSLTTAGRILMEHRRATRVQAAAEVLAEMDDTRRRLLIELAGEIAERGSASRKVGQVAR